MTLLADALALSTEPVLSCPICSGKTQRSLYRGVRDLLFGAPGEWNYDACPACGTVYLNPRPTVDAIGGVYTQAYAARKPAAAPQPGHFARGVRQALRAGFLANAHGYVKGVRSWQRIAALPVYLSPHRRDQLSFAVMTLPYRPGGRLLDVGCGVGDFLAHMATLDWEAEGIDTDPMVLQICRARGLSVRAGTLDSQDYPASSFDAVTLKHVVEHVHEPRAFLRECARILKPGGRLVVLTPNVRSLGHRVFGVSWLGLDAPRHLVLFTSESLRAAAEDAGLRVIRVWSTARPSGFNWRVSYEIQTRGRSSYIRSASLTHRVLERVAETMVRSALVWNASAGDELAMVATKALPT